MLNSLLQVSLVSPHRDMALDVKSPVHPVIPVPENTFPVLFSKFVSNFGFQVTTYKPLLHIQ